MRKLSGQLDLLTICLFWLRKFLVIEKPTYQVVNRFSRLVHLLTISLVLLRKYLAVEKPAYWSVNKLDRQLYLLNVYLGDAWQSRNLLIGQ